MVLYVYAGYPAVIYIIAKIRRKAVVKDRYEPLITIIISAFNEEKHIEKTIENKFQLVYPQEKIEIIVVSDASTDGTDAIVQRLEPRGVKLIRQDFRSGKTSAINLAVTLAQGEILVFSDANSIYDPYALIRLIENFADPSVGYVTGKMIYTNHMPNSIGDGCTSYMKYENFLRAIETEAGSVVGVDGGVDAVRKKLFKPMAPDQIPDFVLPLMIIEQGYRVVYEPRAILNESALSDYEDEYRMRVRVTLRAYWALWDMRHLLGLKLDILYAFQLWSHKVLRYLCFIFLFGSYFANLVLLSYGYFYIATFIVQNILYLGALMPVVFKGKSFESKILYLLNYFVLINLASAHAFIKFLRNQKMVLWTPRTG